MASGYRLSGRQRPGSVLALVLVLAFVVSVLAFGMVTRTIRSARTASWSRDHVVLRLLAESAVEELFLHLQEGANLPGDRTFEALRTGTGDSTTPLPWLTPALLADEVRSRATELGGRVSVIAPDRSFVTVRTLTNLKADRTERAGTVCFDVALSLTGKGPVVSERIRSVRAFSIARAGLPALGRLPGPAGTFSLLVEATDSSTLPNVCAPGSGTGPAVFLPSSRGSCTRTDGAHRTLLASLLERPPEGLAKIPGAAAKRIASSLQLLTPAVVSTRAQFVTTSATQLYGFLSRQLSSSSSGRVDGLIFHGGTDVLPVEFSQTPFRGTCVIASAGPMRVADVKLADPRVDSLTLVSPASITVTGRVVQASLVCTGSGARGVVFAQRAQVMGPVVSARFPRSAGLGADELGQCQIGANPWPECAAPTGKNAAYVAVFSPYPIAMEYRRD